MTTPKAKFAGLALIAALCAGVILGLTACTDDADFNAGVVALREKLKALEQFEKVKEGMKAAGLDDSQVKEFVENSLSVLCSLLEERADLAGWQRQRPGLTGSGYRGRAKIGCPKVWGSRERRRPEFEEQSDLLPTYPLARFLL